MRNMRAACFIGGLVIVVVACATEGTNFTPGDGGVDVIEAGPPPQGKPCVHNDDCTAPNLCQDSNGQACVGGFCEPTGKPMNCDDGVACTDDSCSSTDNKCVHTADDKNCANAQYCDPLHNCVDKLPCTQGGTECDRLDTSACAGLWSCDPQKLYCIQAPPPCPDRPNAATTCNAGGDAGATCSWACDPGFADLNGDLEVPPPATSNGCDCKITSPSDRPDLQFLDANCDGIDGTVTDAIFVDTLSGNDNNPGTMAKPKLTIVAGIGAASTAQKHDVYISKGTYAETITMVDGISLYGGYDAANGWSRATTNVTTIASNAAVAVTASSFAQATTLQLLTITAQDASGVTLLGDGKSSIGVLLVSDSGGFTIAGCTITPGVGSTGNGGGNGSTGAGGGVGGNGVNGTHGGSGSSSCGATGGNGGDGVNGLTGGNSGVAGTQVVNGGTGGPLGSGGSAGSCNTISATNGGPAPPITQGGGQGNPGANGSASTAIGSFDGSGNYLPSAGGGGLTSGYPGGGGGGGGSGGGTQHGCGFLNTSCCDSTSGAGGGGGGGGCGGSPASGGRGGGGSFGIVAISTSLTVDQSKITTQNGGHGGTGGNGGGGGSGAGGGSAGAPTNSGDHPGGTGASGGSGGGGGNGGGGAGGAGGPSICVIYKGTSPTTTALQCANGSGGQPGGGGTNGSTSAQSGPTGATGSVQPSN